MDLQLDEQVAVKRTNGRLLILKRFQNNSSFLGKYHLTKINKILDCDKIEVTWVENGERFRFIDFFFTTKCLRPASFWNVCLITF